MWSVILLTCRRVFMLSRFSPLSDSMKLGPELNFMELLKLKICSSTKRHDSQDQLADSKFHCYILLWKYEWNASPKQLTSLPHLICNLAYARKTFHAKQKFTLKWLHDIGPCWFRCNLVWMSFSKKITYRVVNQAKHCSSGLYIKQGKPLLNYILTVWKHLANGFKH
jgi:hypothetical protein